MYSERSVPDWRTPGEQSKKKKIPYKGDLATFEPYQAPRVMYRWGGPSSESQECTVLHIIEGQGRPYGHSEKRAVCRCGRLIQDTESWTPGARLSDPVLALRSLETPGNYFKLCAKCGSSYEFAKALRDYMAWRTEFQEQRRLEEAARQQERRLLLESMRGAFDSFLTVHFPHPDGFSPDVKMFDDGFTAEREIWGTEFKVVMRVVGK